MNEKALKTPGKIDDLTAQKSDMPKTPGKSEENGGFDAIQQEVN